MSDRDLLARVYTQEKDSRSAEAVAPKGNKGNRKDVALHRALADLYATGRRHDGGGRAGEGSDRAPAGDVRQFHHPGGVVLEHEAGAERQGGARRSGRGQAAGRGAPPGRGPLLPVPGGGRRRGEVLQEGIRLNAKTFRVRFALADVYKNTGRSEQAVAVLNECLALEKDRENPDILTTLNALARVHLQRQEVDKAKGYADEVVKASPKNVDGHLVRGNLALLAGDGAGAVAEFRTVVGARPQFVPGYLFLAEGHLLKKEMNLAQEALQNALKADPKSRDALRAMGRFYAMQKEYPKAEESLRRILEENPSDVEVRADLGDVYLAAKEPGKAEKEYAEIKRLAPKLPFGYVKMGDYYRAQGKRDRAVSEYEAAIKAAPENLPIYLLLGRIHVEGKEYAKAAKAYEEALARRPDFWPAANDLAALLCEHPGTGKELDRALELARGALKSRPDDPVVQDTLGWACYKKGDNPQALDLLTKAQGKLSGNPEVAYHLGMALVKAGKKEQAKAYLKTSVAAKGDFPWKAEAARTLAGI